MADTLHTCTQCGEDANHHGLIRFLDWNGTEYSFCSYGCEFFWRNEQIAEAQERKLAAFAPPR